MNANGISQATHTLDLDVDDPAGADLDGMLGCRGIFGAFVEANGRREQALQLSVSFEVFSRQRLFDHDQVELVEAAEVVECPCE
jgi:hypothetical protein